MTDDDPERVGTTDEWRFLLTRMVNHYHGGRNPDDFAGWGDEIRRPFGAEPYAVLLRAWSLWKLKQDRLPITSLFAEFVAEARRQISAETAKRLPPPPGYSGGRKPPDPELEWAFCTGVAKMRLVVDGRVGELPTEAEIREVWNERRLRNIPVGSMRADIGKVPPQWKDAEQIVRDRRAAGTLTTRIEEYLRDKTDDEDAAP